MSTENSTHADSMPPAPDAPMSPAEPTPPVSETRKRPRIATDIGGAGKERKRGKSMFGLVLGTLNKAKIEDKERNASEAAKKRQLIEQRLQMKLRKETDSVRRAEEAKKDKTLATRKEEDLQLKDSIYKLRRKRLPLLANFLLTSDIIPSDHSSSPPPPPSNPLAGPPRSHPPPLYYLPAILTPAQAAFLERRKAEVSEAAEKEWELFKQEREAGIAEINGLRTKVAEEESRQKTEKDSMDMDTPISESAPSALPKPSGSTPSQKPPSSTRESRMDVDDGSPPKPRESASVPSESEKKEEVAMHADDDDAVEY